MQVEELCPDRPVGIFHGIYGLMALDNANKILVGVSDNGVELSAAWSSVLVGNLFVYLLL